MSGDVADSSLTFAYGTEHETGDDLLAFLVGVLLVLWLDVVQPLDPRAVDGQREAVVTSVLEGVIAADLCRFPRCEVGSPGIQPLGKLLCLFFPLLLLICQLFCLVFCPFLFAICLLSLPFLHGRLAIRVKLPRLHVVRLEDRRMCVSFAYVEGEQTRVGGHTDVLRAVAHEPILHVSPGFVIVIVIIVTKVI